MLKKNKLHLFLVLKFLIILSFEPCNGNIKDTTIIKAGISRITGRIIDPNITKDKKTYVNLTLSQPISGEYVQSKAFVDKSGHFSLDIEVELNLTYAGLYTSLSPENSLIVKLSNGGVTNIDITYNSMYNIEKLNLKPKLSQYDITKGFEIMNKTISFKSGRSVEKLHNKSTDYFLNYVSNILSERLLIINNDPLLSNELKEMFSKDYQLMLYKLHVMDYKGEMMRNYKNTTDDKDKNSNIKKIDKSYYQFLRDFKLNNPQYLQCFTFHEFQKEIYENEILSLPVIGESDIPTWLAKVKIILSDIVGFDKGQYYDVLVANAYAKQLNDEVKQLTKKQKDNIANYWKNGEIAKILFRKNQKVIELENSKSTAFVNDVSLVANNKVIDSILAKHKNKVVLIDLWATWCAPCLEAMQRFRSTKNEFNNKNVAFVYVTNGSSPRKLWEEKIKGIGSEHYYLKDSQWEFIMNKYGFNAIPSYLLYDKNGLLIKKFTAFPENNIVKEMINDLL